MNYMLLVYNGLRTEGGADAAPNGCGGLAEELMAQGTVIDAAILHNTDCATSVRIRDGQKLVTDGPFAETREQLAGYMILDVENLDEAIAIAARHPIAAVGTVEIRPFSLKPMILQRWVAG